MINFRLYDYLTESDKSSNNISLDESEELYDSEKTHLFSPNKIQISQ